MAPFRTGSLIILSLLAACGAEEESNTPPPEPPIEYPDVVDYANVDHGARQGWYESRWVAQAMSLQSPQGMDLPTAPAFAAARWATDLAHLPAHLERPQLVFGSECVPTITGYNAAGDLIDSDGDGIPNDYKVDYGDACVSEIDGGIVRVTISGSRRLQDTDQGFRSFRVTTTDFVILVEYLDTDVVHRLELTGLEAASFSAAGAHYAQAATVKEHAVDPKAGIDADTYRQIIETAEFLPASGQALALHAPLPEGTLTYQADLGHMDPVDPLVPTRLFYHFTIATPTALHYTPGCNGGDFTAGALHGKLNGGEETGFHLSWNGCTALPTRELFGYQ
ncbi:MAG TPA: hypothetical protein VL295_03715 [Gemmatimonadales bacterium]|nr:hypothetical protein [Gemmatimonadales bacterium]